MKKYIKYREMNIERALQWAYKNDCSHAYDAIASYAAHRDLDFTIDYQNFVTYKDKEKEAAQ